MKEITSEEFVKQTGIGKIKFLSEESMVTFLEPKTIHKELYGSFLDKSTGFPRNFVLDLPDAFVAGQIGAVICEDYLLTDTCIRKEFMPPKSIIEIKDNILSYSIAHMWAHANYFHWLLNSMSRISLLAKAKCFESDTITLVNSNHYPWEIEGFNLFRMTRTVPVQNMWWKCKRLIIPSPMSYDGIINPEGCTFLNIIASKIPNDESYPKKIAVIRKTSRKIENHKETYELLEKNGFYPLALEEYTFVDQIKLFKNAECVVAPHGAGLANIVFCKPNTKVLEIINPFYINDCFRRIATYSKIDYYLLMGEGDLSLSHDDVNRLSNITIDIKKLKESLELMVET